MSGVVYLLCFSEPLAHAKHYVGWTAGTAEDRLLEHLAGRGSPLVRAAVLAGIVVSIVLTTRGTRTDERRWHNRHGSQLCPRCRATRSNT